MADENPALGVTVASDPTPPPASDPTSPPDPKAAFLALSLDGQSAALYDHAAALAQALDNVKDDIASIKAAPPVAVPPPEFEGLASDLNRLLRHVFGA